MISKSSPKNLFNLVLIFLIVLILILDKRISPDKLLPTNILRVLFFKPQPKVTICPAIQNNIDDIMLSAGGQWSITIIDSANNIIANYNQNLSLKPASNIKLITTAFALETLGPNFRLKTSLKKDRAGNYHLTGNGDPDLSYRNIISIAQNTVNSNSINNPILYLYDVKKNMWWPKSWNPNDRFNSYGSPITRLSINSNSSDRYRQNPTLSLKQDFDDVFSDLSSNLDTKLVTDKPFKNSSIYYQDVFQVKSAPVKALITLANSESHNYTAEILLRNSSKTWIASSASKSIKNWLLSKNIDTSNIRIVDGSGLSVDNRLTSKSVSTLIWSMSKHRHYPFYKASLSIAGIKGTLSNFVGPQSILYGNLYAKTGTLTGVRSISGILDSDEGEYYISFISNNSDNPDFIIRKVLTSIYYKLNQCL